MKLLTPNEEKALTKYLSEGGKMNEFSTRLSPDRRAAAEKIFRAYAPNCTFEETEDLDAVKGADVISTENWGFFTDPAITWLPGIRKYRPYQVNKELMKRTGNPNAVFIHMLPATHNADHAAAQELIRGVEDPELAEFLTHGFEATDEIFEQYSDVIFREAENRQHTIKAVIQAVVGA